MRALFILLLIYFLTGILQITGDNTFGKKEIGFAAETDSTAVECTLSPEIGLSESLVENQEDQDSKTTTFLLPNTTSAIFPKTTTWLKSGRTHHLQKSLPVFFTNLPPPLPKDFSIRSNFTA